MDLLAEQETMDAFVKAFSAFVDVAATLSRLSFSGLTYLVEGIETLNRIFSGGGLVPSFAPGAPPPIPEVAPSPRYLEEAFLPRSRIEYPPEV
jgi:hypothetical protein